MVTSSVWNFSGPSTLNYPPERFSLPVRPRKRCGLSSVVQAAVEENLVDSAIRVTDDRMRPERHLRPSLRWRSCHVNPAWEEIHTNQSITVEEVTKRTQSTSSFFRLLIHSILKVFFMSNKTMEYTGVKLYFWQQLKERMSLTTLL